MSKSLKKIKINLFIFIFVLFFSFPLLSVSADAPSNPSGTPYFTTFGEADKKDIAVSEAGFIYGSGKGYSWTAPIIRWQPSPDPVDSYELHVWRDGSSGGDPDNQIITVTGTQSPYLDTIIGELQPGKGYRTNVRACFGGVCNDGWTNWRGFWAINPPDKPGDMLRPKPNGAKGIVLNNETDQELQLNVVAAPTTDPNKSDPEKYRFEYKKDGEDTWNSADGSFGFSFAYLASSTFEKNKKYYWRARACADLNGDSSISESECGDHTDEWSFTFSLLAPQTTTIDSNVYPIKFTWSDVPGAQSYEIIPRLNVPEPSCDWWNPSCWVRAITEWIGNWIETNAGFISVLWDDGEHPDYDPSCPWTLWNVNAGTCEGLTSTTTEYTDTDCIFVENWEDWDYRYSLTIASCFDEYGRECGSPISDNADGDEIYMVLEFLTANYDKLQPPIIENPWPSVPTFGRNDSLSWYATDTVYGNPPSSRTPSVCANALRLVVTDSDSNVIVNKKIPNIETLSLKEEVLNPLFENASRLNKKYDWKLYPCWQLLKDGITCENSTVSLGWEFNTAGVPPTNLSPTSVTSVPVTFSWDEMSGANFYNYEIATDNSFTNIIASDYSINNSITIGRPPLNPQTTYYWRVSTCVCSHCPRDESCLNCLNGTKVCGDWSTESFTTYSVSQPTNLRPATGTIPNSLVWNKDPGSHFYQYSVDYVSNIYAYDSDGNPIKDSLKECEDKVGTQVISETITPLTSLWLSEICMGEYTWHVRSCFDKTCTEGESPPITSNWTNETYIAEELETPPEAGIVPCGRRTDIRSTPYDERERCQLKHLGFMAQNIVDFLMWRLGLIVIALLGLFTGVVSYFSFGNPETLVKIKSIWKAVGWGYLIMLFSWFLINLIMGIAGFDAVFFGRWWELPF